MKDCHRWHGYYAYTGEIRCPHCDEYILNPYAFDKVIFNRLTIYDIPTEQLPVISQTVPW